MNNKLSKSTFLTRFVPVQDSLRAHLDGCNDKISHWMHQKATASG